MSPLARHEWHADFLGNLVTLAADELGLPIVTGGSLTLKRKAAKRGLEPGRCYWLANQHLIRGKDRIDLRTDPPPDLAIEVDITSSSLGRMPIYAALAVPEVWRLTAESLEFLGRSGHTYHAIPQSLSLPPLTAADLTRLLAMRPSQPDGETRRQFVAWLRSQITPPPP